MLSRLIIAVLIGDAEVEAAITGVLDARVVNKASSDRKKYFPVQEEVVLWWKSIFITALSKC